MQSHTKCKRVFLAALAIVLGVIGLKVSTHWVFADSSSLNDPPTTLLPLNNGVECWPLDVVVLIDESDSMVKGTAPNDSEGYRLESAKAILNLLISERRGFCPEALHRFGVIAFTAPFGDRDDGLDIVVPLREIDIPVTSDFDRTTWETGLEIEQAIDGLRENHPIRNGTDPALAFAAAGVMLDDAPMVATPQGYQARRQVVILLTDGNPQTASVATDSQRATYMRDLSQALNASSWAERHIWIVAMGQNIEDELNSNRAFDDLTMYEAWQAIAESHAGHLLASNDYSEQILLDILGAIIDNEFEAFGEPIPCGEPFVVEPYLQSLVLRFNKSLRYQEDYPVLISYLSDAGQEVYRFSEGEVEMGELSAPMVVRTDLYYREGTQEEYVFDYPLPGRWRFIIQGVDPANCAAYVAARRNFSFADVVMQQPLGSVPLNENPPYTDTEILRTFQIVLQSDSGTLLTPLPDYPLVIVGRLRLPDNANQLPNGDPIPQYTFTANSDGYWVSDQLVLAPMEGLYELDLWGAAVHGSESYAVITDTITYEVLRLGRLHFAITAPQAGQRLPCNNIQDRRTIGRSIPVTVQLFDSTGQSADADFYLDSDPAQSFEATFLDAGGNPLDTITLVPASQDIGLFEGILMETIPNVVGCGAVSAQVTFKGGVDETRFVLSLPEQTVSFERPQAEGVLVALSAPTASERFLLHLDFWSARNADVVDPVSLVFTLTDLDDQVLLPTDVVKGAPESLYNAQLIAPDGQSEALTLTVSGATFSASGGLTLTQEGMYTFEIAASDAFKEGYIPGDTAPVTVSFERYDALWTKPTTFKTVAVSSTALLVFLIALTIFLLTGAPRGVLEITEFARPMETLAGPFGLSSRRFPTFKNATLSSLGIKRIRARKAKSFEGGRTVYVKIVDSNGMEIFSNKLEVDQPTPLALTQDVEIVYH